MGKKRHGKHKLNVKGAHLGMKHHGKKGRGKHKGKHGKKR